MKKFILNRAREASTWRGIVLILTACGVTMTPDQADAAIATGLAVVGAVGAFFPDAVKGGE